MTSPMIVEELHALGYELALRGENIHCRYTGVGLPPRDKAEPLLGDLKSHKREVIAYLQANPVIEGQTINQTFPADPCAAIFQAAYYDLCVRHTQGSVSPKPYSGIPLELAGMNDRCTKLRLEVLEGRASPAEFRAAVDQWHNAWLDAHGLGANTIVAARIDGVKP